MLTKAWTKNTKEPVCWYVLVAFCEAWFYEGKAYQLKEAKGKNKNKSVGAASRPQPKGEKNSLLFSSSLIESIQNTEVAASCHMVCVVI